VCTVAETRSRPVKRPLQDGAACQPSCFHTKPTAQHSRISAPTLSTERLTRPSPRPPPASCSCTAGRPLMSAARTPRQLWRRLLAEGPCRLWGWWQRGCFICGALRLQPSPPHQPPNSPVTPHTPQPPTVIKEADHKLRGIGVDRGKGGRVVCGESRESGESWAVVTSKCLGLQTQPCGRHLQ
jgi:hypothetical protein